MSREHPFQSAIALSQLILLSRSLIGNANQWGRIIVKHGEIVPVHSIVAEMSSVTLYAGSPTNVSWIFPSYVAHPYRHLKLPRQLILNNLVEDDSGFYTCFGMFSDGKMFFSLGYIEVYKKPDPGVLVPYPLVVASVGGSVKLNCASVKPVKWIGLQHYETGGNELSLGQLKRSDSGPFLCIGVTGFNEIFHRTTRVIVNPFVEVIPGNFTSFPLEETHID